MPQFASGGYVPKTSLALVHEGEYVLPKHVVRALGQGGGGGGVSVAVNIGRIGGSLDDLTPDAFGRLVGAAAASEIRNRGGMRALVKETARSGL